MSAILFLLKKSIQNLWRVVLIWVSEADPLILGFGCLVPFGFPLRPDKRTRGMKRNSMRLPPVRRKLLLPGLPLPALRRLALRRPARLPLQPEQRLPQPGLPEQEHQGRRPARQTCPFRRPG